MKKYLKETTYSEILKLNGNSRWKADKIVEYYEPKKKLISVGGKTPNDQDFVVNFLTTEDLKYKAIDFEPPIGIREWVAWGLLALSILCNLLIGLNSC